MAYSEKVKNEIWEEANFHCANPNCSSSRLTGQLDIHHIIPIEDGGTDDPENLILLCSNCHHLFHKPKHPAFSQRIIFDWKNNLKKKK